MKKIISIGELLIDFIPNEKGNKLKDVHSFIKMPGGAPANVCVQVSKLNQESKFIGQIGKDGFGDFLKTTLNLNQVNTDNLYQTSLAKTALAFVTLTDEGERDFAFYRNPSADQLLNQNQVKNIDLSNSILHFCSLSLDDYPLKDAVTYLLEKQKKHGGLISFDPNLRFSLLNDLEAYRAVITSYLNYADILKISDDELFFITQKEKEIDAISYLFSFNLTYLIITRGQHGVTLINKQSTIDVAGYPVDVVDTTGAGDSWIGAFLSKIAAYDSINDIDHNLLREILTFANAAAALTTTKKGAISALPNLNEVMNFIKYHNLKNQ